MLSAHAAELRYGRKERCRNNNTSILIEDEMLGAKENNNER